MKKSKKDFKNIMEKVEIITKKIIPAIQISIPFQLVDALNSHYVYLFEYGCDTICQLNYIVAKNRFITYSVNDDSVVDKNISFYDIGEKYEIFLSQVKLTYDELVEKYDKFYE